MKNSIKQLLRTPGKVVLFFLLMAGAAILVTVGANLFYISSGTQDAAEGAFTTIGMVEQKVSSTSMEKYWDPYLQDYAHFSKEIYDAPISADVLDLEGMPYVHKPKQRPFYGAYKEGYIVRDTHNDVDESWLGIGGDSVIVEVEPFEDCVPDHPVKLHFKKTLYGKITERMLNQIWFWDYTNPEPQPLYAGRTYIMAVFNNVSVEYRGMVDKEKYPDVSAVWTPWIDIEGYQYTKDGTLLDDSRHRDRYYSEVTDGFYQTAEGKRWLNMIEGFRIADYSIPVIPTDATNLLTCFYNQDTGIAAGRDITEEEYREGKNVCLIQEEFAVNNQLKIGDSLELPLYYADYSHSASFSYPMWSMQTVSVKLINADGELYTPFWDEEYEVVGIYKVYAGTDTYTGHEAAKNGVIIPAASVKSSDENNILGYGPMKEYNTVFQIENGRIDDFGDVWNKQGIDNLKITFYDKGYSSLEQSFQNTRRMSRILLVAGVGTTLLILLFFCHIFIAKQKLRTAVERSLGMTKRQCGKSLLSGMLVITAAGCAAGSGAGALLTGTAVKSLEKHAEYSSMYSAGKALVEEMAAAPDVLSGSVVRIIIPVAAAAAVFVMAYLTAYFLAGRNLKEEPMELLARMKNEL